MARIATVEPFPLRIPMPEGQLPEARIDLPGSLYFRRPHRGLVYARNRETLLVRITTDDGQVGWGETLASVAPQIGAQIIRTLLAPQLIGRDPCAGEVIWTDIYRSMRDRRHLTGFFSDALAGCDTALWDLRGKILGQPVYTLLGGPYLDRVPLYASGVGGATPEARATAARGHVEQGFEAIKLHLTSGRDDALATVAAVREAVGPGVKLMVDAHNTFDVAGAIQLGRELERYDVFFFEAPTDPENVAGLAEIAAALQVRIATGESERSRYQFRDRLVARAIDVAQPDLGYVGLSEMLRIAVLAEAFHVPLVPPLSAGLGTCIAATLHLVTSIPNFLLLEYQEHSFALANRLLRAPLRREGGYMLLPEGPGLGVEPDEAVLAAYRIEE